MITRIFHRSFAFVALLTFGSLAASHAYGGAITVVGGTITNGATQLSAISGTAPNGNTWASYVTGTNPVAYFDLGTGSLMFDPKGKSVSTFDFRYGYFSTIGSGTVGPFNYSTGTGNPGAVSTTSTEKTFPAGTWANISTFPARLAGAISLTNTPTLAFSGGNIASSNGWFNQPWSFGAVAPSVTQSQMFSTTTGEGFRAVASLNIPTSLNLLGYGDGIGMFLWLEANVTGRQYGPVIPVTAVPGPFALVWAATGITPGGSGDWRSGNWVDTDGSTRAWFAGSKAIFSGTFSENFVTVAESGVSVGRGISFSSNGYTLSGGAVALTGGNAINNALSVDTGLTATISNLITASGGLLKSGSGTLVLGGNVLTSSLQIDAGTLVIGTGGTTGSVVGNIANAGSLRFNRSDASTYDGAISGTGSLTKLGTGMLTLTGSNSYSGGTTISGGTLVLGSANAIGSTGPLSFDGGELQFTASNATDYSARFSSAPNQAYKVDTNGRNVTFGSALISTGGSLTKLGPGTLFLSASNSYSGGTAILGGTLSIGDAGTAGSISGDIANAGHLVFNRSDAVTYGGKISGTGSVTKIGTEMLTLTGSNSYSGVTTIQGGTLLIGSNSAVESSVVTVQWDATLRINTKGIMRTPGIFVVGNGQAILPTATRQIVSLGSLSIDQAAGGRLDIGKGRIEIAPGGITEAELRADLIAGRGEGNFAPTNSGIVTSALGPVPFIVPSIGYMVLPSGTTIVAWSAFGDVNLNGRVDFDDVVQFVSANKYNTGEPAAWADGDFDYNGVVDFDDIRALVATGLYDKGSYLPGPSGMTAMGIVDVMAVPEPSTYAMALAGLACGGFSMWRRRNRA